MKHTIPSNDRNFEALKRFKRGTWDYFIENHILPLLAREKVELEVLRDEVKSQKSKLEDLDRRVMKIESQV